MFMARWWTCVYMQLCVCVCVVVHMPVVVEVVAVVVAVVVVHMLLCSCMHHSGALYFVFRGSDFVLCGSTVFTLCVCALHTPSQKFVMCHKFLGSRPAFDFS